MFPKSLKHALLLAVTILILISGVIISQLVTHRYSVSLLNAAAARAENIAHKLALDSADKILVNDLVALHKILNDQIATDPSVAYLFIVREGRILTHTFSEGVPSQLISANTSKDSQNGHLERIISENGERFLDIAWPIFSGKAGMLRLGLSAEPYHREVAQLWIEMSLMSFGVLILALIAGHLFIHRLTRPLLALSDAAEKIDAGNLKSDIHVKGRTEVNKLAAAFNGMLMRLKDYTDRLEASNQKLEEKNRQLDRTHRQLHTSFRISTDVAGLADLSQIASYLIQTFKGIVECQQMALAIFSENQEILFMITEKGVDALGKIPYQETYMLLKGHQGLAFIGGNDVPGMCLLPLRMEQAGKLALFPIIHHEELLGGLFIGCPKGCLCVKRELDIINLILEQTTGAMRRALLQEEEIRQLRERVEPRAEFAGLVGKDPQMHLIYQLIENVSPTDATVLIQGESGTGKELVARAIHNCSSRCDGPFVVINCSAYPATLLESELFGHEKGAFTGAMRQKPGRFEQANGGTVFLDEIGEMSASAQIKLLRVLQSRRFERLGGEKSLEVDVRVLAATNKKLLDQVRDGNFREDLFYRLNVVPINLPPLRKRRNDIPLLAGHFLKKFMEIQKKSVQDFSSEALRILLNYHWPGNVRELENSVEHAMVLGKGAQIEAGDLPELIQTFYEKGPIPSSKTILENEIKLLQEVLEECNWNKTAAAARLGISRSTLYEKLKRYSLTPPTLH